MRVKESQRMQPHEIVLGRETSGTLNRLQKAYVLFAILIFSFTAACKLLSNFAAPKLGSPDPFIPVLTSGQLLVLVAILEIAAVGVLIWTFSRNPPQGILMVLWLCAIFLTYRMGFALAPEKAGACKCFGVGSLLGQMEANSDLLSMAILAVLSIGGVSLLSFRQFLAVKNQRPLTVGAKATRISFGLLSLFFASNHGLSQEVFTPAYIANGIIHQRAFNAAGKATTTDFPFTVRVGTKGQWQIEWEASVKKWSLTSREHISFDGKNIFSVVYADKRLNRNMLPVNNLPLESHENPGRVSRGPFPVDHGSGVGLVWLAFLGGDYIARFPTDSIPDLLVSNARFDPSAWVVDCNYHFHSETNTPRLLSSASFVLNPAKAPASLIGYPELDEPNGSEATEAMLQAIKRLGTATKAEFVRSTYSLDKTMRVGNVQLPSAFSSTHYSMIGSSPLHYVTVKLEGEVTNAVALEQPIPLLPPIKGQISVQDRRTKTRTEKEYRNDVYYKLDKTGWLPSTNDPRFPQGKSAPLLPRASVGFRRGGYMALVTTFSLLLLMPVLVLIWRARKKP